MTLHGEDGVARSTTSMSFQTPVLKSEEMT